MTRLNDIANRHHLAAAGLEDAQAAKQLSVRVIVDENWASSATGQLLASCLVNLLCRQAGLVSNINVIAESTPRLIWQPGPNQSVSFPECLSELARWAVGDLVSVSVQDADANSDFTIVVGLPKDSEATATGSELIAIGDGWRAWVGERQCAPRGIIPESRNPLGPFLAASLAAGEVFKRSRGILLRGRYLDANGYSLWTGESSSSWSALRDGPTLDNVSLPPIHVVGVGAVGNGLVYCLASAPLSDTYGVLIDDDIYDETNLNRCFLAGTADVGEPKVAALERALKSVGLGVFPFGKTIREYVTDQKIGLRKDVASRVNDLDFGIVVSCVDKGSARQDVQGLWPSLLAGGSTLGMRAQSNVYGLRDGGPCLACHNPAEHQGEKLRSLEKQLRNMASKERAEFLRQNGLNTEAIEEYLSSEKCGTLGEKALRDFATQTRGEFSVGFVSLGAALLLCSSLFREAVFSSHAQTRKEMTVFNYLNGGFADSQLAADPDCQLRCYKRSQKTREPHK